MIEDQRIPKRCGFARGVAVVDRAEAVARIRAAVDARDEGADVLILGRTDAAAMGIEEGLWRARAYQLHEPATAARLRQTTLQDSRSGSPCINNLRTAPGPRAEYVRGGDFGRLRPAHGLARPRVKVGAVVPGTLGPFRAPG